MKAIPNLFAAPPTALLAALLAGAAALSLAAGAAAGAAGPSKLTAGAVSAPGVVAAKGTIGLAQ